MFEQKQLRRIYAVEGVNGDNRVYVDETSDFSKRILFENEIIKKYFVNLEIHLTELLTASKAQEEVEKVKKKYRDNGWRILN